ncbi:hypothetical protein YC2023_081919 [Brassica napus]
MEVPGCLRAPLSTLPMTFVPLAYGAIFLLFAPGRHSLCASVLSSKATVLLRPWAWRVWVDVVSCDFGNILVHRKELTWAALCFPLGEPLSAFSGRHSMTRRLVLNLRCHGHVDGIEFLRPQAGHRPLDPRWKEPRIAPLPPGKGKLPIRRTFHIYEYGRV